MNIRMLLFFSLCCNGISLSGMQKPQRDSSNADTSETLVGSFQYRQARTEDLTELLKLINTQAVHDNEKIVILPKKFRRGSLLSKIEKNRIFVAEDKGKIVGYKKLFLICDETEKNGILKDEIRCINNEENCTFAGSISIRCINNEENCTFAGSISNSNDGKFSTDKSELPKDCYNICIYNGGDFTLLTHRRKGINQQLTNMALLYLIPTVKKQMHDKQAKTIFISMVYGITAANAGKQPGGTGDRTPSISTSFKASFIQVLENHKDKISLQHRRYRAFMPTFDPESQEQKPLPDKDSVAGFGCVLIYQLRGTDE